MTSEVDLILHPVAIEEGRQARLWYETSSEGLGDKFINTLDSAVSKILESPERWPFIEAPYRRYLMERFPFGVIYRCTPKKVTIFAVAHLRRKPGYWRNR